MRPRAGDQQEALAVRLAILEVEASARMIVRQIYLLDVAQTGLLALTLSRRDFPL